MRTWWIGLFLLTACVGDSTPVQGDGGTDATTTDSGGGDAAADAAPDAPAPFTPASFGSDLALWLVGDDVSDTAGQVDTWYDQSTYKTNPTQADTSFRPLHEQKVLNGHDVVDFNGSAVALAIAPDADAGTTPANLSFGQTDDFVIAAVVSESANMPAAGWVFVKTLFTCTGGCAPKDGLVFGINVPSLADEVSARESIADGYLSTTGVPLADHAYHVVVLRRIGETTLQLRTDGVPKNATITGFDVSQPQVALTIGASQGTFQGTFAFRMAELVAVHRTSGAINDADVSNIEPT